MRTYGLIAFALLGMSAMAQIVNDSFEDGGGSINGWSTSSCVVYAVPMIAQSGDDRYALAIRASDAAICNDDRDSSYIQQLLPWIADGSTCDLSWWWRQTATGPSEYAKVLFGSVDAAGAFADHFSYEGASTDWTQVNEVQLFWVEPGSTSAIRLIGGRTSSGPDTAWFDRVSITPSVGINELDQAPHFGPNPAVDHLWVALNAPAFAAEAIDATGRVHRLAVPTFCEGVVDVRVEELPPALYLLRLNTSTGPRVLRFIKGADGKFR